MSDRLLERRYGRPFSAKWWQRRHDHLHERMVELACPLCPSPAEVGAGLISGAETRAMSYNDVAAAWEAADAIDGVFRAEQALEEAR